MKKLLNASFIYAGCAMAAGVFYREFTKFNGFTGKTMLGVMHPHLFALGGAFLMLLALFSLHLPLTQQKGFKTFWMLFNIGLPFTMVMMLVRGVMQVLGTPLSKGMNAAISGIAGIGHILLGCGLAMALVCLKRSAAAGQGASAAM